MDEVRAVVVVEQDDLAEALALAEAEGATVKQGPSRGFEPVSTVTLIIIGVMATVSIVVAAIDRMKGGQVIDLRVGAPQAIYRTKDLVFGLIVILADDGTVTVDVKQPDEMFTRVVEALVTALGDLATAGVEAAAQLVREVAGGRADVKVEPLSFGDDERTH